MTGCRTCGGTFTGPVGTAAEALKFSANVGRELPTCPALETRATDIAPDTDGENESMIKGDVEPIIFRISSRPHAPAVPSAPSTQARKGRRPAKKPFNPMEFSKSRARFRNWVLGQEQAAGAWGRDEIRNIVGSIAPWSAENNASGAFSVGDTRTSRPNGTGTLGSGNTLYNFNASLIVSTGPQNVPQHVWQPVILYLGRPK